jgi:hypothetical protein
MNKKRGIHMKKLCIILVILCTWFPVSCVPLQEKFLTYGIYYGNASDPDVRMMRWSQFDIMILYAGSAGNNYQNLEDPAFLIMMQSMKDAGVQVFLYTDIGCEKDYGGMYYSRTESSTWLAFKKREIDTFMRYADGVFFDCVRPAHGGRVYPAQFGRDVQELVDYVHYSQGEVIISDLWGIMRWVASNELDLIPYEADYFLIEGAWSLTSDQYADYWDTLNIINFAKSNNLKILGLDFGRETDRNRFLYCYCASRVFGFSGFYYAAEDDLYEKVNTLNIPYLGLPLNYYTIEEKAHTREFQKGKVFVILETHKGWIEGEAAPREAGVSVFLVLIGLFVGLKKKVIL